MIGVMRKISHVIICSDGVTKEEVEHMGFAYAFNIEEALNMAYEREGEDASVGILTHGADIAPVVA